MGQLWLNYKLRTGDNNFSINQNCFSITKCQLINGLAMWSLQDFLFCKTLFCIIIMRGTVCNLYLLWRPVSMDKHRVSWHKRNEILIKKHTDFYRTTAWTNLTTTSNHHQWPLVRGPWFIGWHLEDWKSRKSNIWPCFRPILSSMDVCVTVYTERPRQEEPTF